ncbi:hypothetical protein D187_004073 [Cystobacter fuscus DSM 2262]|uniref:Uncharacterized protein n=1 Tax=Cystobacter fuscus (strain ATCC 25194 / DSM 2262 / NBRC 100088 / M29) TaxID=1242864 RepID=S9P7W3_CYSF2|nr:hypothetical protein D187_004073 [Cystobacter fuscus DSM 2262]
MVGSGPGPSPCSSNAPSSIRSNGSDPEKDDHRILGTLGWIKGVHFTCAA